MHRATVAFIIAIILILFLGMFAWPAKATVNCSADPTLQANESEFLALLNQYRAANGAGPLVNSPTMSRASQWMANDLAAHPTLFGHTDSTGRDFFQRMVDCGVVGSAGENIAGSQPTALGTLNQWKGSPGHNSNMLNPGWRSIGIGAANGGMFGYTWVTDFSSSIQPDVLPTPTSIPTPKPTPTPTPAPCRLPMIAKDGSW